MQVENVFTAFSPYLAFTRFLGFNPISFQGNPGNGKLKVKIISSVVICLISVICGILNIFGISSVGNDPIASKILYYGWILPSVSENIFQVFLLIHRVFNRFKILRFLNNLHNVDEKVKLS
jgi:7tm Chemosensory receptor